MPLITTLGQLEALYGPANPASLVKETDVITAQYRAFIEASPFAVLATSGPEGLDCSPRGDGRGFVRVKDDKTLLLPDRRGNNRIDSLRNIVRDPRVSLLFMVPGVGVTFRVIGRAVLRTDTELRERFAVDGKPPTTVIEVSVEQAYTQCPKALIRSDLWNPERYRQASELPSVGQINEQITEGAFDGAAYDAAYPERIRQTIY